mmetsp:Transcript_68473/g.164430  ORF Transcript_68473/g.164430 Transcript_68473/m.164430 type:complete len:223 (-) Transcript_68473:1037-1705(-)
MIWSEAAPWHPPHLGDLEQDNLRFAGLVSFLRAASRRESRATFASPSLSGKSPRCLPTALLRRKDEGAEDGLLAVCFCCTVLAAPSTNPRLSCSDTSCPLFCHFFARNLPKLCCTGPPMLASRVDSASRIASLRRVGGRPRGHDKDAAAPPAAPPPAAGPAGGGKGGSLGKHCIRLDPSAISMSAGFAECLARLRKYCMWMHCRSCTAQDGFSFPRMRRSSG